MRYRFGRIINNKKRGFTLIEVVLAIALFSILGSLTFTSTMFYARLGNNERTVANESVNTQMIVARVEGFIRESSQNISIDKSNVGNLKTIVIRDLDKSSSVKKISIELENKTLKINNVIISNEIESFDIERESLSILRIKVKSSCGRVPIAKKVISIDK